MWYALLSESSNLYTEEELLENASIVPFLMFCVFLVGVIVVLYGAVNLFTEWREFRIFYDSKSLEEKPDFSLKKKKMRKYGYIIGVGFILLIISYL